MNPFIPAPVFKHPNPVNIWFFILVLVLCLGSWTWSWSWTWVGGDRVNGDSVTVSSVDQRKIKGCNMSAHSTGSVDSQKSCCAESTALHSVSLQVIIILFTQIFCVPSGDLVPIIASTTVQFMPIIASTRTVARSGVVCYYSSAHCCFCGRIIRWISYCWVWAHIKSNDRFRFLQADLGCR